MWHRQDAPSSDTSGGRETISDSLVVLGDIAMDNVLLKQLNLDILMYTRADDTHMRVFALQCAHTLWTAHGNQLAGAWASLPSRVMKYLEYLLMAGPGKHDCRSCSVMREI
jgi:hypothetical protein